MLEPTSWPALIVGAAAATTALVVHRKLTHGFLGMLPYGPLAPPHALELAKLGVRFLADGLAGAGDARRG